MVLRLKSFLKKQHLFVLPQYLPTNQIQITLLFSTHKKSSNLLFAVLLLIGLIDDTEIYDCGDKKNKTFTLNMAKREPIIVRIDLMGKCQVVTSISKRRSCVPKLGEPI